MYCRAGQATEEEMYNNETAGPAFEEFLEVLGLNVRLKGFRNYRAGLNNKSDTTGFYSVYSTYEDCEIMFHVSTMLPYTPSNKQQICKVAVTTLSYDQMGDLLKTSVMVSDTVVPLHKDGSP
ncbi:signal-induced proliferation-associated protein 1-like [Dermacentor andersoni]|uniref:signal-induced proliferation-associated protein 1-like n=1 Tax=Dermacentor andersoni TaxID=34620 RepID=UPI002416E1AD|nr:signal-induced proliferation-associated 1-like protein 2 [Dermacentor andersoni]XP_054920981.1 signal-induced proliferation-associated 1-like protein 2 [Dermacentor andersoni]